MIKSLEISQMYPLSPSPMLAWSRDKTTVLPCTLGAALPSNWWSKTETADYLIAENSPIPHFVRTRPAHICCYGRFVKQRTPFPNTRFVHRSLERFRRKKLQIFQIGGARQAIKCTYPQGKGQCRPSTPRATPVVQASACPRR